MSMSISNNNYNKIYNDMTEKQKLQIEKQDEILEEISLQLQVNKNIALLIGNETDEHNNLLSDFNNELTSTNTRLNNSNKKIDQISYLSNNKYTITIILLIIIVIIMIIVYFT